MQSIKETHSQLKISPLFQLSLSSKELFHSNFFLWLAETYPEIFGHHFSRYLDLEPNKISNVRREHKNLDIDFQLGDKHVIIENKVKSIPNKEQLEKYKAENPKSICVLLSMIQPDFEYDEFCFLDYDIFLDVLVKVQNGIDDMYHRSLIKDYIFFTRQIKIIIKSSVIIEQSNFIESYMTQIPLYQNLRLHDIFIKHVMIQFAKMVANKLEKIIHTHTILNGWWTENTKGNIYWKVDFVKGKGIYIIGLDCNGYILGFMLDGNRLLQFIEKGNPNEQFEKFAQSLEEEKWFNSLNGKKVTKNRFNKFDGGNMLYQYSIIDDNVTFGGLANNIVNAMKNLIDDKPVPLNY